MSDPYLWEPERVMNFRKLFRSDPNSVCTRLKCPERKGLVAGLYALVAYLTAEKLALEDECEQLDIDAQIAKERGDRLEKALADEWGWPAVNNFLAGDDK